MCNLILGKLETHGFGFVYRKKNTRTQSTQQYQHMNKTHVWNFDGWNVQHWATADWEGVRLLVSELYRFVLSSARTNLNKHSIYFSIIVRSNVLESVFQRNQAYAREKYVIVISILLLLVAEKNITIFVHLIRVHYIIFKTSVGCPKLKGFPENVEYIFNCLQKNVVGITILNRK